MSHHQTSSTVSWWITYRLSNSVPTIKYMCGSVTAKKLATLFLIILISWDAEFTLEGWRAGQRLQQPADLVWMGKKKQADFRKTHQHFLTLKPIPATVVWKEACVCDLRHSLCSSDGSDCTNKAKLLNCFDKLDRLGQIIFCFRMHVNALNLDLSVSKTI